MLGMAMLAALVAAVTIEGQARRGHKAERRLWVNADKSALAEEGSLEAAHLLAGPGDVVPVEQAEALGLEINHLEAPVGGLTADRRLWLNADKDRLREEGHAEAAHLLAAKGDLITSEWVERLQLTADDKGKISSGLPEPEPAAESAPADPAEPAKRSRAKKQE